MNIAKLTFDKIKNKWMASYNGHLLVSSASREYVVNSIRSGRCTKATNFNVTDIQDSSEAAPTTSLVPNTIEQFGINERFDFLTEFTTMVVDRTSPSLVVTGEGGLGKSFTVMKTLKECGLVDSASFLEGADPDDEIPLKIQKTLYTVVKGYSTAKGLFRTLYENRNRIVVFDDCDSVLKDPVAVNLLKGALDSYDKRIISWNSEGSFGGDDLPRSFQFSGGVIFISNLPMMKVDQAIRSRAICVDLSMTTRQKIERMATIIENPEFMPDYSTEVKAEAIKFLDENAESASELSLRSLITVIKVAGRGDDWKRRAEYLLSI
jgi:hypothetical protein